MRRYQASDREPRPALAAFGAPLMVKPRHDMPLEEALAPALRLLDQGPLFLSLPGLLALNKDVVEPRTLVASARECGVEPELGMLRDLTAELSGGHSFAYARDS